MSLLKEADFVRFGSTNRATELSKSDQLMLLDGMENRDIATFQTMNRLHGSAGIDWNSSKPYIGGLRGDRGLENLPKAIPVRCYVAGPDLSAPDAYEIFQAPILINNFSTSSSPIPDGNAPPFSWTTLGEAVYSILKDRNVLDTEDDLASSEIQTFASLGSESHPSFSNSPHHTKTSRPQWTQKWKCIIQGISPSWDTPLLWISDNLSYPDNFIHIVLIGIS
ncbi:hypothetical protein AX774_g593 [Zancudomyces culisetae]|uniref:Autophagy protein 5 n=1 Tax=Zancudomyces culisetae TaxID=1213189 RepID=A0A1R1PY47_ZANCU|nr:hypothetical protein AX774_g593 [Zancudomyces culisetae]|eukprot:OMH85848.1 hypothetical protein AX774_g593 [Zancudomyces culisetae]